MFLPPISGQPHAPSTISDAFKLPSVVFGLLTLGLMWWGVALLIDIEAKSSRRGVANDTANLSLVFEQNVIRTLKEVDKSILYLRHAHARARDNTMWPNHIRQAFAASEMTFQLAIIDERGRLLASDRGPQPPVPIDLSDREHFRVHAKSEVDTVFVSRPVLGRVSKQWSVQITRRLTKADGSFDGVIVASLDPDHFSRSFSAVNVGAGGVVSLVGLDGVVRASGNLKPHALGSSLDEKPILDSIRHSSASTIFYRDKRGIERIATTRRVAGYDLALVVAADEHQPDGSWSRNAPIYLIAAAIMSLLILAALSTIARRNMRLLEAQRQLSRKSAQHAVTLENMSQGILMVEPDGRVGFMNERLADILGLPRGMATASMTYGELVEYLDRHGEFRGPMDAGVLEFIRQPEHLDLIPHYERERPDGTVLEVRTKPIPGGGFVRTISDITGRRRAEKTVLQLARHDTLTGLSNRAVFRQQLNQAVTEAGNGTPFALLMIDLDRFKPVNDTYGHATGDLLLKAVADRLRATVRNHDLVSRLGGDEFAVIQREVSTEPQCAALANRICNALAEPFTIEGHVLTIGASVGIARGPDQGGTAEELLIAADLALYSAKAAERGTYAFYREELHEEQVARRELELDLRAAIHEEQFELHYQPIISINSGTVTAYEALLRWRHPERGLIPPLDFIPFAEETGLIRAIGAWVLRRACQDIGSRTGEARVAINLSPVQFRDQGLVDTVKAALEESGLEPSRLEIEITELTLMQNDSQTQEHLEALRKLGVHITMDDFGTGYSALSYLMNYPIQSIKIDRSFVQSLGKQKCSRAIIRTISTLAQNLGMSTTAEGVETPEQLAMLREVGCTEAQGFYFSKPKPAAEILPPIAPPRTTASPPMREAG